MIQIFFDMDGVLADFDLGVCQLFNHSGRDGGDLGKDLHTVLGCEKRFIWMQIEEKGRRFWENIPVSKWANELIDVASDFGDIFIATAPSYSPNSAAGKLAWLQKKFGKRFRDYVIIPDKSLLAKPHRLLIDDSLKNCLAFKKEGGRVMHFPTYANGGLTTGLDPIGILKQTLQEMENL